ncbi:MarR family winged helix-turn-helix transcriptional regulator [Paraburkholderia sp.]|jgi:DNA-binding MarR family transcriptional regulator|uniref:MarR family winged helix-turn-helix transcriptional regulator n=1 Tax=Paraburkholderia sp. TaxID=1926495 RepID=UPI002F40F3D7
MSDYPEDIFLPVQRITFALSKARHLLTTEMDGALVGTGLRSSHVGALLLLSLGIACSSVELSRLLGVDPAFITRVVDRLERQGLVHRDRDRPDRRVVKLTLTEAGRDAAARIADIVPEVMNQRLSSFTPLEFATLCRLVTKLLDE